MRGAVPLPLPPARPHPGAPQCTRIEIGVQSVYEDVARDTNRGHTVGAVCHSFSLAKDCGFKVVSHMMPDLPNMGAHGRKSGPTLAVPPSRTPLAASRPGARPGRVPGVL